MFLRQIFLSSLVLILFLALLLPLLGLTCSKNVLVIRNAPRKADVIVVLGGENVSRTEKALELYRLGFAPTVLVSGSRDGEIIAQSLIASGVPRGNILIENYSKSTFENASLSYPILKKYNFKSIILVTSWFHSRRATSVFSDISEPISVVSVPTDTASFKYMVSHKETTKFVLYEYLKVAGYWFIYGISPLKAVNEMDSSLNVSTLRIIFKRNNSFEAV
jgi:uncharacterized SAM-binding protein YcdF (DUF218 family)